VQDGDAAVRHRLLDAHEAGDVEQVAAMDAHEALGIEELLELSQRLLLQQILLAYLE